MEYHSTSNVVPIGTGRTLQPTEESVPISRSTASWQLESHSRSWQLDNRQGTPLFGLVVPGTPTTQRDGGSMGRQVADSVLRYIVLRRQAPSSVAGPI
jgi:hypothetical protein